MGKRVRQMQKRLGEKTSHIKTLILHGLERPVAVLIDFRKDEISFQMEGDKNGVKAKFSQMLVAGWESMKKAIQSRQSLPHQIREAVDAARVGPPPSSSEDAPSDDTTEGPDGPPESEPPETASVEASDSAPEG